VRQYSRWYSDAKENYAPAAQAITQTLPSLVLDEPCVSSLLAAGRYFSFLDRQRQAKRVLRVLTVHAVLRPGVHQEVHRVEALGDGRGGVEKCFAGEQRAEPEHVPMIQQKNSQMLSYFRSSRTEWGGFFYKV
jgi:hypothetical protein